MLSLRSSRYGSRSSKKSEVWNTNAGLSKEPGRSITFVRIDKKKVTHMKKRKWIAGLLTMTLILAGCGASGSSSAGGSSSAENSSAGNETAASSSEISAEKEAATSEEQVSESQEGDTSASADALKTESEGAQTEGAQTEGAQTEGAQTEETQTEEIQTEEVQAEEKVKDGEKAQTEVPETQEGTLTAGYPTFDYTNKTVTLNSSYEMPILGLDMFSLSDSEAENSTYWALKAGFRLIDTATIYGNEEAVGRGLRRAIDEGIVTREEVFITTKMWTSDFDNGDAAVDASLQRLGLDYIDLMILHHSQPSNDVNAYQAMESGPWRPESSVRSGFQITMNRRILTGW